MEDKVSIWWALSLIFTGVTLGLLVVDLFLYSYIPLSLMLVSTIAWVIGERHGN